MKKTIKVIVLAAFGCIALFLTGCNQVTEEVNVQVTEEAEETEEVSEILKSEFYNPEGKRIWSVPTNTSTPSSGK